MRGLRLLACGFLLVLGACATPTRLDVPDQDVQTVSRAGRFAVRVSEPFQNDRAVQGGFVWLDQGSRLTLDLTSPLGATLARVEVDPEGALLKEANGRETRADTPEQLVQQALGVPVPVSVLRHWVRGLPAPGQAVEAEQRGSDGRLSRIEQAGWRVEFGAYDAAGPTRLTGERQLQDQTVHLRLVITP